MYLSINRNIDWMFKWNADFTCCRQSIGTTRFNLLILTFISAIAARNFSEAFVHLVFFDKYVFSSSDDCEFSVAIVLKTRFKFIRASSIDCRTCFSSKIHSGT